MKTWQDRVIQLLAIAVVGLICTRGFSCGTPDGRACEIRIGK